MGRGGHRGSLAEARPARRRASRGPRHACCAPCGTPRPPSLTPPVPAARPRARRRRATPGPRKPRGPPPPSPSRAVQASDALSAQPCTIARPDRHECPCGIDPRGVRRECASTACAHVQERSPAGSPAVWQGRGRRSAPRMRRGRGCVAGARLCGRGAAVWLGRIGRTMTGSARESARRNCGRTDRSTRRGSEQVRSLVAPPWCLARWPCDPRTWLPGPSRRSLVGPVWRFALPLRARRNVAAGGMRPQRPYPRMRGGWRPSYPRPFHRCGRSVDIRPPGRCRHTWAISGRYP